MLRDKALLRKAERSERNRRGRVLISFFVPVFVAVISVWVTSSYFKHKNEALRIQQDQINKQSEALRKLFEVAQQHGLEQTNNVVPITSQVKVKAAAEQLSVGRYQFRLYIEETHPQALDRISKVDYTLNHPSFSRKVLSSSNPHDKFQVTYVGWGCLTSVIATFTPTPEKTQSGTEKTDFNMCADLGW